MAEEVEDVLPGVSRLSMIEATLEFESVELEELAELGEVADETPWLGGLPPP